MGALGDCAQAADAAKRTAQYSAAEYFMVFPLSLIRLSLAGKEA
jgi:hypothetical protein